MLFFRSRSDKQSDVPIPGGQFITWSSSRYKKQKSIYTHTLIETYTWMSWVLNTLYCIMVYSIITGVITTFHGLYLVSLSPSHFPLWLSHHLLCISFYLHSLSVFFAVSCPSLSLPTTDVSSGWSCPCPDTSSFLSGSQCCSLYWCFKTATVAVPLGLQLSLALCDCLAKGAWGSL